MDLYTWENEANVLLGFQLAYDRRADQRAITWIRDRGYFHARIEEDMRGLVASTPLLQPEGRFDAPRTHAEFLKAAAGLDPDTALFVSRKLSAYRESSPERSSSIWQDFLVAALAGAIIGLAIRRLWK